MTLPIVRLSAALFAVLLLFYAVFAAAVLVYHLGVVGEASPSPAAVHWVFLPGWRQSLPVALVGYLVCLLVAWLCVTLRQQASGR